MFSAPDPLQALRGSLPILLLTVGGVWSFGAVFFAVALAGSELVFCSAGV